MDNNELDKKLKEMLKNKITIPKETEKKILQKVDEEKRKRIPTTEIKKEKVKPVYKRIAPILSIAAMFVIVFTLGIILRNTSDNITRVTIEAIEPTKVYEGIIANDSDFIIYTDGESTTVEGVQKSIYVEPALDYTIEKIDNEKYKLEFEQNIPDNTIVKLQYIKNKITENSWAYQTSNKLSVTSTYPDIDAGTVDANTVIEIKFSYASVENLEENVEITPQINGSWEHLGNIWRFTPDSLLEENQKYTIKINKGLKADDETLEEDYIFYFTVNTTEDVTQYTYTSNSIDGINAYKSNEQVRIYYNYYEGSSNSVEIDKIEISKFETVDEFVQYLETNNYENAQNLGEVEFEKRENYLELRSGLQNGYYVAKIMSSNNNEIFNCPIQINDLSAYALETERDVLVWVAEGDNLAKDIDVQYLGKEQRTNENGLVIFEDIADNSKKIKYLKVGNTENQLVIGIYNYELSNYPNAYLYTDRPLYKNTDTINIWAFVPTKLFYEDIEDEFYIEINEEGKQKVKIDEQGNINYKIELNNHMDEEYTMIWLYYKDNIIASREIEIENYELQNYTYNVIMDKNYVSSGEKFEFEVQVEHITGLNVPSKNIAVEYNEQIYRETTDENGVAKFSIDIEESDSESAVPVYNEILIYNGDEIEYTTTEKTIEIYVINKDIYSKFEYLDDNKFNLTLYNLDLNRKTNVSDDLSELHNGNYNTEVEVTLVEEVQRRIVTYTYNEYTKENEPNYSYEEYELNREKIRTISTENGTLEFDANELELKKDTEEFIYYYTLEFEFKDRSGRNVIEEGYIYKYEDEETGGYIWYDSDESSDNIWEISEKMDINSYYIYRYFLKRDKSEFVIGDTVNLTLAESTKSGANEIQNQGKILRIVLQEDITKTDIIENDEFNYTFEEQDFPGCKITSAYFYNGKFYRMPIYYFDFEQEAREVDVEIVADKEQYSPGDEVTLTIKTTNNGTPIKTSVNISVVNKAVFELQQDSTEILQTVYTNKAYPIYTYSTYRDSFYSQSDGRRRRRRSRSKRRVWRYCIF